MLSGDMMRAEEEVVVEEEERKAVETVGQTATNWRRQEVPGKRERRRCICAERRGVCVLMRLSTLRAVTTCSMTRLVSSVSASQLSLSLFLSLSLPLSLSLSVTQPLEGKVQG